MRSSSNLNQTHHILLVEDDHNYARLLQVFLEGSETINYNTTHCTTLEEGCRQLEENEDIAAVLLDLSLPDSHGFETLSRLLVRFPKLNVIVLTGQSDKQLGLEAVKAGAQDFLVKGEFDGKQLAKALRYSIERSNILLRLEETQQLARIGHWECSPKEHLFNASEEVYRIFGLRPDEPLSCDNITQPNSPFAPLMAAQREAYEKGKAQQDRWIKRANGEQRFVIIICSATAADGGSYVYNGIVQDITERKQAEEMRKARDLAEHTAKVREQFIAGLSHEMRTPMNAILGMSGLLLKTPLNVDQGKYVHAIQQSSEVLLEIINEILDTSAIQNDQVKFVKKDFQLDLLLESLIRLLQPHAEEKGLELRLQLPAAIPKALVGDSGKLNQILYNLMGNAIKFTEKGRVQLVVQLEEQRDDKALLRFEVTDTGIGIAPEEASNIFQPFYRIDQPGKIYEGTGLGLSITKALIERQGGRIGLRSSPGEGSHFYFTLDFDLAVLQKAETSVTSPPAIPADYSFRLLLVEDHELNRLVAQRTLEGQWANIALFTAENGNQAIDFLKQQPVDIVLMDIQMPERDGISTLAFLRSQMPEDIAHTSIIAITAHTNIETDERFQSVGFDDVVLKPFSPEQLLEKIRHHLYVLKEGDGL